MRVVPAWARLRWSVPASRPRLASFAGVAVLVDVVAAEELTERLQLLRVRGAGELDDGRGELRRDHRQRRRDVDGDAVGRRVVEPSIDELIPYIDWTFFFTAWELKGRVPAIFEHPQYGQAAKELYDHARTLLDTLARDKAITARGVYGFWPANSDGDDIVVFTDDGRREELARFHMLDTRQYRAAQQRGCVAKLD